MKVVLLKDVQGTGKVGDVKDVNDGYATNKLIPSGYAKKLDNVSNNESKQAKQAEAFKIAELIENAKIEKEKLEKLNLVFSIKMGENGKAFGSVSSKEISEKLKELGFEIERKKIELKDPIKSIGNMKIKIKIYTNIVATLNVSFIASK